MKRKLLYSIVFGSALLLVAGCVTRPVPYADYYGHSGVVFTGDGLSGIDLDRRTGKVTWGKVITKAEINDVNRMRKQLAERDELIRMRRWLQSDPEAK